MNRLEFPRRLYRITPLLLSILFVGCAPTPVEQPSEQITSRPDIDISGVWLLDVESPIGREKIVARFEQSGTVLAGEMTRKGVDVPLRGVLDGDAIQFDMTFDVRGKPLTLQYNGTVQGEGMSGTVQFGPMGTGSFSGRRTP